ncbi:hypothetical protein QJS04_geneDACA005826 [Acorus gramineus]|uniref:Protein FATTY ACID EXPORT 3, chloroplastic n=1 Tax=Acorus gramineus TaxID=55184 RepID=A0AAV9B2F2_ACOGR|nr:hypothetical protein QJS04_geneDACA005826 [Acorus gramineus]
MAGLETFVSNLNPNIPLSPPPPRSGPARLPRSLAVPSILPRLLHRRCAAVVWRRGFVALAASHEESRHSEIEVENGRNELNKEAIESQEEWKRVLETFKEEALKMQAISQKTYEEYSKKAMVIMGYASEKFNIESEKARNDLTRIAKEISEEGKVCLSAAAENSPEEVKDIVETFASYPNDLKEVSELRDFYLGIPYGAFLSVGGFLSFMLTGSISAIRFGVILGGALLALSILSLRSYKSGQSSSVHLKGQAAIAFVIFIRELGLFSQGGSFPGFLMSLIR